MKARRLWENVIHGWFLLMGLVTVGCVLLITVYLIISGIPAIREIGLIKFLFGPVWDSNGTPPQFGILSFILTSIYGTAGAIVLGVPIGFMTAVFLAKMAPARLKAVVSSAVSLLAGIPSVVYGLVGMLMLVPGIRKIFHIPDGSGLLAAIIVLAIMILPSIINVAMTALEAVPKEYEDASLALGATPVETWFRVSVPAARSGIAAAVVLGMAYPATLENGPDGKKRSTQLTQDFQRRFTERFRKLDCHDLLAEKDIEGTPTAQELGVTQHCRLLVVSGVELLSDMLDELEAR